MRKMLIFYKYDFTNERIQALQSDLTCPRSYSKCKVQNPSPGNLTTCHIFCRLKIISSLSKGCVFLFLSLLIYFLYIYFLLFACFSLCTVSGQGTCQYIQLMVCIQLSIQHSSLQPAFLYIQGQATLNVKYTDP